MTDLFQNDKTQLSISWGRASLHFAGCCYVVLIVLFLAIFVFIGPVLSQDPDDVVRIETELAAFEVTATDTKGKPVAGLSQKDFRLFENGVERQIDFFQPIREGGQRRPLLVVFALDVSGSMTEEEIQRLRTAAGEFLKRLSDPNSYFAMITFAMNAKTVQEFTNRTDRFDRAFARIERDQDGLSTHAFDAIDDAVRMIDRKAPKSIRGQEPRRAVVVITDGFPVGDVISPQTVIERANKTGVSVFSVILPSYSKFSVGRRPLLTPFESSGLVAKTGGISLYANEKNLEPLFNSLAERIATTYSIAFYPDETKINPGEFRRVRVESTKGFRITQNRPGYQLSKK